MLIRISREQTVAIATLSLVLASSLFVIGAAFGEPAKQEAVDATALGAATTTEKLVARVDHIVTPLERKATAKGEQSTVLDAIVDFQQARNPTDDPLALFNTPIP